jgi:hypothetical protein
VDRFREQFQSATRDHSGIVEELRARVNESEKRYEELIKQYHRHEDKVNSNA